ncbi:hypothetical protein F7725_022026, partial [Dissostichus mawsoni]
MALLRKVNQILVVLLLLMVCLLLHSSLLGASPRPKPADVDDVVPVVICASEERIGAAMASINSVSSNTHSNYIMKSKLKGIKYKILEFNPMVLKGKVKPDSSRPDLLHPVSSFRYFMLNFVRFYLPLLDIHHKRVIYLDDDVIVQGKESFCNYVSFGKVDLFEPNVEKKTVTCPPLMRWSEASACRKQEVRDLGINPRECSFNPGVFVADIREWKKQKITKQLEKWMEENFRQNIYSSAMAGGVATPPMLIVFHDKYTTLDPLWHVRHLDARYAESFLQEALLLHWNGPFKPWSYPAVHLDLWEKWFVPDPSRRFSL